MRYPLMSASGALCALAFVSLPVAADWSVTVTGASDYLFNGISQTGHKPALQGSLDWSAASGVYASLWASNVDFDEGTNLEVDGYLGYVTDLPLGLNLDTGLAYYSYHGTSHSMDLSYPELYAKLGAGWFHLKLWYTSDYSGLSVDHGVVMLQADIPLNDSWTLQAWVDRSTSFEPDRFEWDRGRDHYYHWQVMAQTQLHGIDVALGYSDTDLSVEAGDPVALLTLGYSFDL